MSWNAYVGKWQVHAWTEDSPGDDDDDDDCGGSRARMRRASRKARRRLMHIGYYPRLRDATRSYDRFVDAREAASERATSSSTHRQKNLVIEIPPTP